MEYKRMQQGNRVEWQASKRNGSLGGSETLLEIPTPQPLYLLPLFSRVVGTPLHVSGNPWPPSVPPEALVIVLKAPRLPAPFCSPISGQVRVIMML